MLPFLHANMKLFVCVKGNSAKTEELEKRGCTSGTDFKDSLKIF